MNFSNFFGDHFDLKVVFKLIPQDTLICMRVVIIGHKDTDRNGTCVHVDWLGLIFGKKRNSLVCSNGCAFLVDYFSFRQGINRINIIGVNFFIFPVNNPVAIR